MVYYHNRTNMHFVYILFPSLPFSINLQAGGIEINLAAVGLIPGRKEYMRADSDHINKPFLSERDYDVWVTLMLTDVTLKRGYGC